MGNTLEANQLSKKLMSWKETCAMEQRLTFVKAIEEGDEAFAEQCRAYGISRKTGYKWRKRYALGGAPALADQSRAPHQQAHATSEPIVKAILGARSDTAAGARKNSELGCSAGNPISIGPPPAPSARS